MKLNRFYTYFLLVSKSTAWNHVAGAEPLNTALRSHERALVAYVLPNDKASQALESEWASAEETAGDKLLSVDCSTEIDLCHEHGVSSFPVIRLYDPDGTRTQYRGPRKAPSILSFLRRTTRPAVTPVTPKIMTTFQSIDDIVIVGHFSHGTALQQQFKETAAQYHDRYSFGLANVQTQAPKMECFNNLDGLQRSTTEFPSPTSVEAFVKLCATRLIPEFTRRNELSFYETRKSIVHYFTHDPTDRDAYVAEMRPLAKKYEEYLHFVTTDANEYADAAEMMGLKRGSTGLSVQNPNNGDVFPYTRREKITAGSVEAFLGDIIQGRVQAWRGGGGHDEL